MKLVIVESPAKTAKISGFLGSGYKVIASFGHIRALEPTLDAVGLETDFTPKYEFQKEKTRAITAIRAAAAEANEVILASDDDREGEAIAYSVAVLLRLPAATTKRAVFHEITKTAVCNAIANPRVIDMNRVYAQQSRAMLDMMVGFTISPLLWRYVAPGLSAGRCQTPALRFVCEREEEIEGHTASSSWGITGEWMPASQKGLKPQAFAAQQLDDIADDESATAILEILRTTPSATITKAATTTWSASAPAPLITSTLQQEASALFKYNPKSTMSAAQKLYEGGHITYMRTDSAVLSEEAATAAKQLVEEQFGAEYVAAAAATAPAKKPTPKSKKAAAAATDAALPQAQEAHEAIRPTHFELNDLPADQEYSQMERKLYKLIWQRAVQSVMAAAQGEQRIIQFLPDSEDAEDFPWQAKWRRTTFPGWKALGVQAAQLDEESEDTEENAAATAWQLATSLKVGAQLQWQALHATPKETKAAPRYTEATLVRELERKGIGRPSTFASLIAAIQDKGYVETKDIPGKKRIFNIMHLKPGQEVPSYEPVEKMFGAEKGKLVPTALGRSALAFALQHFEDLFSYNFTAEMEKELDEIAKGAAPWKRVLRKTWDSYSERYTTLKDAAPPAKGLKAPSDRVRDFGSGLKAVLTKKGPLLLQEPPEGSPEGTKPTFYGWVGKKAFHDLTEEEARRFAKSSADKQVAVVVQPEEDDADADGRSADADEQSADGSSSGQRSTTSVQLDVFPPKGQIIKKQGKYGWYAECDGVRVSCNEQDTYKELAVKLTAKSQASKPVRVGVYEFRVGQYGPYMFKTDLKTKKFVSVPKGLDPSSLTVKSAEAIYKAGLEAAANKYKKKPGSAAATAAAATDA